MCQEHDFVRLSHMAKSNLGLGSRVWSNLVEGHWLVETKLVEEFL